jgi:streptogramin lyase
MYLSQLFSWGNQMRSHEMSKLVKMGCLFLAAALALLLARQADRFPVTQAADEFAQSAHFPLPEPGTGPRKIIAVNPGEVWFTLANSNQLGRLMVESATSYTFDMFDLPTPNSEPYDLVFDGAFIWVTEHLGNKVRKFDVGSELFVAEYAAVTEESGPAGIDIGPDGHIWFAEMNINRIGRIDPIAGEVIEYDDPAVDKIGNAQFEDIVVDMSSRVWVTAPGINSVVVLEPATSNFNIRPVQVRFDFPLIPPGGITLDKSLPKAAPWISAPTEGLIGIRNEQTFADWFFKDIDKDRLPIPDPTELVYRTLGNHEQVWYIESESGRIGRMTFDQSANRIQNINTQASMNAGYLEGLAIDGNSVAWITDSGSNQLISWIGPDYYPQYLSLFYGGVNGS